jgi:hypothetical protein
MGSEIFVYPYIVCDSWKEFRLKYSINELDYLWKKHDIYAEEECGSIYFFLYIDLWDIQRTFCVPVESVNKRLLEIGGEDYD